MKFALLSATLALCAASPVIPLEKRDSDYTAYGEGKTEAIDAPGIAYNAAYKGFPSGGIGPAQVSGGPGHIAAIGLNGQTAGLVPEGMNPTNCTVKDGQYPVILIPGTVETAYSNWAYFGPRLVQEEDLCVYSFNHNPLEVAGVQLSGFAFGGDIKQSAAALGVFVDEVLALTGADKVDFIGHSQGAGALPYWYLKSIMQGSKVRKMIGLAPSVGTESFGLSALFAALLPGELGSFTEEALDATLNAGALLQQLESSEFMKELHDGGMAVDGVQYVNIETRYDFVLEPYTNQLWTQAGADVTNVLVQDKCWQDFTDHDSLAYDPLVFDIARNYLLDRDDPLECKLFIPPPYIPGVSR